MPSLYPFQEAGVKYAVAKRRTWIADPQGLGKTPQALLTLRELNDFPALIVTTATQKLHWFKEARKWLPERSVGVADGTIPNTDLVIINYDLLDKRHTQLGLVKTEVATNTKAKRYKYTKTKELFRSIVLDESHKVKGEQTLRTKATEALAKGLPTVLCLTGSPIVNRPAELIPQLRIMGRLHEFGGWMSFVQRYCNAHRTRFGLDISGSSNLAELHRLLRERCMIRREKRDVLTELPPIQRTVVPLEIDNRREYDKAEHAIIQWLALQAYNDEMFLASLEGLPPGEVEKRRREHAQDKASKARRAEQLVKLNALKQLIGRGKLNAAVEWIEDFLEQEDKLVVFAVHHDIQQALLTEFPDAAHILAEDSTRVRQENIDRFHSDPDCQLIICSLDAAAEGWTGTAASSVVFVELGWTPGSHEQAEGRVYGRLNDPHGAVAYYLLGAGTIDEWLAELIERKRQVIKDLTGTKGEGIGNIYDDLAKRLLKEREGRMK